jgi:hypothetical protein
MATCTLTKSEIQSLEKLIQNYCNAATDLRELVNDIQGRWEEQYEVRSDCWKENSEDAPQRGRSAGHNHRMAGAPSNRGGHRGP